MEMVHFIPPSQRRLALLAAQADSAPVLIYGASGTGKGAIAKWIHVNSARASLPLVITQNSRPLVDQIAEAQGGSLIVHEVGELPLGEQKILLNFLNTKSIPHTKSENTPRIVNCRVIATTNQALEGRAQVGLFNAELLEKLNVFRLEMPSLSKRAGEFNDIVLGIIGEITRELHKEHLRDLSPEAWVALKSYEWPGNLRELRNVLRIAVVTAKGDLIELNDIPRFGADRIDFRATREQFEKIYIQELLRTFHGQIDETCRMTRMDKATLLNKINLYGINLAEMSGTP